MGVWAISDLHLSSDPERRMDRFGTVWQGHPEPLAAAWRALVGAEDLVLVPGDLCWALRAAQAVEDLAWLEALPGRKIVSPGNHDWDLWKTQTRARRLLAPLPSLTALKNDALRLDAQRLTVCAVRGSYQPGDPGFRPELQGRFQAEQQRLQLALERAAALRQPGDRLAVMIHYPPFVDLQQPGPFSELIEAAGADLCLYGHLHHPQHHAQAFQGVRATVHYHLVSCDALGMRPLLLFEE